MDNLVIDCPETVEAQGLLVVVDSGLHHQVWLVAHNMIDFLEFDRFKESIENFLEGVRLKAGQEGSLVVNVLNEGVGGISIGLNC